VTSIDQKVFLRALSWLWDRGNRRRIDGDMTKWSLWQWYFAKWAHQPIFPVIVANYLQSGCYTFVHNINTYYTCCCRQMQKTLIHSNSVEESKQVISIFLLTLSLQLQFKSRQTYFYHDFVNCTYSNWYSSNLFPPVSIQLPQWFSSLIIL